MKQIARKAKMTESMSKKMVTVAEIREVGPGAFRINRTRGRKVYFPKPQSLRRLKDLMHWHPQMINGETFFRVEKP